MHASSPVFLGLDTGGTFTDAVLWRDDGGKGSIVASAKALTTRHDLSVGIAEAAGKAIAASNIHPSSIRLVSMSTTLATNALVEGQGGRVALVLAGFDEKDLARGGLRDALGGDPVLLVAGGHDVHGMARHLDLAALDRQLDSVKGSVSAFAVAAMFAVCNPEHEIAIRDLIREHTGLPVTCSHELSAKLGAPRRAVTCLLNARLIGLIERLIRSTEAFLQESGIRAPLMVVRGDGALVSAAFAHMRPIETILSGPAASLVGAHHLTGLDNAIVSDIGGTTTDVAILDNGRPRIDPEGATVGGHKTMVEAVAMRTHGLGGDSEVTFGEAGLEAKIVLGPRRLVPLSLVAMQHAGEVVTHLDRQVSALPGRLDGRFAFLAGMPQSFASGLTASEKDLFGKLTAAPQPLDRLLASTSQAATLNRLAARGLALIAGFTPSDAAHVAGRQATWNTAAAELGARLLARRKDGRGRLLAETPRDLAEKVLAALQRRSAEVILETAFTGDGLDAKAVALPIVQRALDGGHGISKLALSLDRPVIGLGASAGLHYAGLDNRLGATCIIPAEAGVANAVGAVVGQVKVSVTATVSCPSEDRFRVTVGTAVKDFASETEALEFAATQAEAVAATQAAEAGTDDPHFDTRIHIEAPEIEGRRKFVEAVITVTAAGRARIAVG